MRKNCIFSRKLKILLIVGNDIIFLSINVTAIETIDQIYNMVLLLLEKIGRGELTGNEKTLATHTPLGSC